jgi:hypothetical protein
MMQSESQVEPFEKQDGPVNARQNIQPGVVERTPWGLRWRASVWFITLGTIPFSFYC